MYMLDRGTAAAVVSITYIEQPNGLGDSIVTE